MCPRSIIPHTLFFCCSSLSSSHRHHPTHKKPSHVPPHKKVVCRSNRPAVTAAAAGVRHTVYVASPTAAAATRSTTSPAAPRQSHDTKQRRKRIIGCLSHVLTLTHKSTWAPFLNFFLLHAHAVVSLSSLLCLRPRSGAQYTAVPAARTRRARRCCLSLPSSSFFFSFPSSLSLCLLLPRYSPTHAVMSFFYTNACLLGFVRIEKKPQRKKDEALLSVST